MNGLRVDMVSEHASPLAVLGSEDAGGQNVYVAALAAAIAERGCEVTVWTRRDDATLPESVPFAAGVTVRHLDAGPPVPLPKDDLLPLVPDMAARLEAAWAVSPPDVVHSHFWMSGLAAVAACRAAGIPVVHTYHALGCVKRRHQGGADTSPPAREALEAALADDVDLVVATSCEEVDELQAQGADPARIRVIPCGVDTEVFRPRGRGSRSLRRRFRLASVGRLVERKGVADVVAALALAPEVELVVAGGPAPRDLGTDPAVAHLREVAAGCGVSDRVRFVGSVAHEKVPDVFAEADAVVVAPWYEPFGMVAVEAMACGLPVVASAVGGHHDTIVDGCTGVLVPPRDPEAIATAVLGLAKEPDVRRSMGNAATEWARSRYAWSRIAADMCDAYASAVATTPLAGRVTT